MGGGGGARRFAAVVVRLFVSNSQENFEVLRVPVPVSDEELGLELMFDKPDEGAEGTVEGGFVAPTRPAPEADTEVVGLVLAPTSPVPLSELRKEEEDVVPSDRGCCCDPGRF